MKIELVQLDINDSNDIYLMLQEIPQEENGFMNSAHGKTFEEFKTWLIESDSSSKTKELVDGWKVPSSTYWLYVNGTPVGMGKIRHFLTEKLLEEGGHIGYAIRPSERNKGYGTILLKRLLSTAKNMGIDNILLTIRNDNVHSLKVAISNRGIIEKSNDTRSYVWIR